jgi:hypothetical protein
VDAVSCGTLFGELIGLFVIDIFQISSGCDHTHSGVLQPLAPSFLCALFEILAEFFLWR